MKKLLLVLTVVAMASFLFVGCDFPGAPPVDPPVEPPVEPTAITATIGVANEWADTATGKTYVKGGSREITVTFSETVENPVVKVGTVVVPVFTLDDKVFKGTGAFVGPCDAVLITVGGVCEDLCAAKSVVVDSGKPYAELKATAAECDCYTGYALTISSDWEAETDCETFPGCCGDDCSGLASWNVKIYDEDPWDDCCVPDPCIDPIAEADGTACPITVTTECIDEVYTPDGWEDFFDGDYWVIATLIDKVGNEIKYYGWVSNIGMGEELGGEIEFFLELYIDPTTEDCWCPAEDPDYADFIIGDCDGTPTTECWIEPLEPCPVITVVPADPVVGQPATVTINYTLAVKPTGVVAAYVGPAFKTLPLGVPEGSSALPLEEVDDYIYEANVVFGEAGDRIIYVVDACEDCPPCTENITVLPADVCPVVEFLDAPFEVDGIPYYALEDITFTVTFANRVEKELVEVFIGDPDVKISFDAGVEFWFDEDLGVWAEIGIESPMVAEIDMTTEDEITYTGTIPLSFIATLLDFLGVDSEDMSYANYLGCLGLKVSVLAGDPCCVQTCEYPLVVDPAGPFAAFTVTFDTCEVPVDPACWEDTPEIGYQFIIENIIPPECEEETWSCCGDTCSGLASWEVTICMCYPYDDCDDYVECPGCDYAFWTGTTCEELEELIGPCVPPDDEMWEHSPFWLNIQMTDNVGNVTEYRTTLEYNLNTFPQVWQGIGDCIALPFVLP